MVNGILGFEGFAINAWLVWMLPFIGACYRHSRDDTKLEIILQGLSLASAIFATLLPLGVSGGEIHSQIPWISYTRTRGWSISGSVVDTHD